MKQEPFIQRMCCQNDSLMPLLEICLNDAFFYYFIWKRKEQCIPSRPNTLLFFRFILYFQLRACFWKQAYFLTYLTFKATFMGLHFKYAFVVIVFLHFSNYKMKFYSFQHDFFLSEKYILYLIKVKHRNISFFIPVRC